MVSPLGDGTIEVSDWLGVACQDDGRLPVSLSKSKMVDDEHIQIEAGYILVWTDLSNLFIAARVFSPRPRN